MLYAIQASGEAGGHHLRVMDEARKRVFVDLLKSDVPVSAGRYELDEFDNEDARYLIIAGLAYTRPIARHLPRELAALIGYRQHRPNLGNHEGRCPSILLDEVPDAPLGAVDALRPEQAELVEQFVSSQRRVA